MVSNEAKFIVGVPAQAGNLVISEIHYNPIGNSEENEFIELTNISNEIIELAGKFIKGIRYEFKDDTKLKPMEKLFYPLNYMRDNLTMEVKE